MLIDELQTAIKSNRGHLAKLGPQLQAEQEQFSSCVCQHLKSLPANTVVPGGLQLKVGVTLTLTGSRQGQKHSVPLRTCVTLVPSPPQRGGLTRKGKEYYSENRVSKGNNYVSLKQGFKKLSIRYRKVNLMNVS